MQIAETSNLMPAVLAPIVSRVRTDVHWIKRKGQDPDCIKRPLTDAHLAKHLNGGPAFGCCPIRAGESTTRVGIFDLDSHKGETPWPEMARVALLVVDELKHRGMHPIPFRSSGGKGIHILLIWDQDQDAYSVIQFMDQVLQALGFKDGTAGVQAGEIEIFPKQDHVGVGRFGSMFVLPLTGASVPLWYEADLEPLPRDAAGDMQWPTSPSVPVVAKPERIVRNDVEPSVGLKVLRSALQAIPNEDGSSLDYDSWRDVIFAIHYESGGSDEGLALAHEFSARSGKYDADFLDERVWPHIDDARPNPKTGGAILKLAAAHGWQQDYSDEFEPIGPLTEDEETAQVEIRARNAKKWERAARMADAAIERAKFESGREALEAARREHQKQENEKIGEGEHKIPVADVITLDGALNRFVFLAEGSQVGDIFNPHYALNFADWAATYRASTVLVSQPDKELANGKVKKQPDKEVEVSRLWIASPHRKTAVCRTFKAGGPLMLPDPDGKLALNMWKPYDRSLVVEDIEAAGVGLFLEHVHFLFGTDAERFLDWLAHIEQYPGVLPHTGWLHIAKSFGMGRNWMASVLARVWAGNVAANLDLVAMLNKGFNGRLSRKVLAIVDEIREGGRDSQWEHSEKLKSIITEETRSINPKYGRESTEFNSCRWLMFSNHISAIPLEAGDRRFEVVFTDAPPRDADYYARLYTALQDKRFIAGVATFLGQRDIRRFNPGTYATNTAAKQVVTKASQSPTSQWCEMLVKHWPSDVIASAVLAEIMVGIQGAALNASHRRALEQFGLESWGSPIKVDGKAVRVTVVRNKERWANADAAAIREELKRGGAPIAEGLNPVREYLEGLSADE